MIKTSQIVEWALKHFPDTRNSDEELLIKIWEQQGMHLTQIQKSKLRNGEVSLPRSIERCRRILQAKGMYEATDKVQKDRVFKSAQVQQNAPSATPERLTDVVEEWTPRAVSWLNDED